LTIPISDRLLTRIVSEMLLPSAPVAELAIHAEAENRLLVGFRIPRAPAFVPPIRIPVHIARQPELPDSPVLVLKLGVLGGLAALAGSAMRAFDKLPRGVQLDGDAVRLDLRSLLESQGMADLLRYVRRLEVTTVPAVVLIRIDVEVGPPNRSG